MANNLPVYEYTIDKDNGSDLQVSAIALVDEPAIGRNWFAFADDRNPMQFAVVKDDEQLIIGPAMIPDLKIYRNDKNLGEFHAVFSKETVCMIAEKFYAKNFQGNANLMHDPAQTVTGVNYFMSMVRDTEKGIIGMAGDYPEGTWFVGARITDPAVWAKIKSGEIKGFSVEGFFELSEVNQQSEEAAAAQICDDIEVLLTGVVSLDEAGRAEILEILNGIN